MPETCDYCGTTELVYELSVRGGYKHRCIECLAIEQLQQRFTLPFDAWLDQDEIGPTDHPDDPLEESFDPRKHDYETARAWSQVLARLKDDDPLVKPDPDTHGVIYEDTREFLINVMGADAHRQPSTLREGEQDDCD